MLKLVSKLLILLCLWNVTIGVYPGFALDIEAEVKVSASNDDFSFLVSATDCNGTDHQDSHETKCSDCHLGHCQFDARTAGIMINFVPTLGTIALKPLLYSSFYPSSLIKPPSA